MYAKRLIFLRNLIAILKKTLLKNCYIKDFVFYCLNSY
jgi:hypothetical protein